MEVAILICTYKRPIGFKKLVDSLAAMAIPPGVTPVLCIADNNPAPEIDGYIAEAMDSFPWAWHSVFETQRGYASARNASIELGLKVCAAGYFCMTDDDEVVPKNWLTDLMAGTKEFQAEVIVGAYGAANQSFAHGVPAQTATTGNVCFSHRLVSPYGLNLRFNQAFDEQGGEDRDFFERAYQHGARIVKIRGAHIVPHEPQLGGTIAESMAALRSRLLAIASLKRNAAAEHRKGFRMFRLGILLLASLLDLAKAGFLLLTGLIVRLFNYQKAKAEFINADKSWLRFLAVWQGLFFGPISRQSLRSGDNY